MTVLSAPPRAIVPPPTETAWTLDVLGEPDIAFKVYGIPAPQGSKNPWPVYAKSGCRLCQFTGRVSMSESSDKVKPWRAAVAAVARQATRSTALGGFRALEGPLVADMVFTMPKGTTLPKWLDWHERYPDVSKLARSTEDALTKILWKDDAQLSDYRRLAKRFVGSHDPDVLDKPGAVIRLWRVPDDLIQERRAWARRRS